MVIFIDLLDKVRDKSAVISVFGLGYVGLPLSSAFASQGFRVVGVDVDVNRVEKVNRGQNYITDRFVDVHLNRLAHEGVLSASTDGEATAKISDFIIMCVPTPLTPVGTPNLDYLKSASETISKGLQAGKFVILESTGFPGMTEEVIKPILEKSGLKAGLDFGLAYSPERIDPGNKKYSIIDIPKVVGGLNKDCLKVVSALYGSCFRKLIAVSDIKTAEATKVLENTFRAINIAFVNELSQLFETLEINIFEVIEAAASKPFGFLPHYPSPGVGGDCIPVTPLYLNFKAKEVGKSLKFVELTAKINAEMPNHVLNLVLSGLYMAGKRLEETRIAVMGLAYKGGGSDTRLSPSIQFIKLLLSKTSDIVVFDPYVKEVYIDGKLLVSTDTIEKVVKKADCAVFITSHPQFKTLDLTLLKKEMNHKPVIVDTQNFFLKEKCENLGFIYQGLGKPHYKKESP